MLPSNHQFPALDAEAGMGRRTWKAEWTNLSFMEPATASSTPSAASLVSLLTQKVEASFFLSMP